MFRSRGAVAEADVAPWPERAEDVRGGRIADRHRNALAAGDNLGHLSRRVQQYRAALTEHEATLRNARPGADLVAVAAAREGVQIYTKALQEAAREMVAAEESYHAITRNLAIEWSRVLALKRQLTGQERLESGEGGVTRDRATLINELESLIGSKPAGL